MFIMVTDELFLGLRQFVLLVPGFVMGRKSWDILHNKYLCSRHFLESDFTTAERVHFNRVAVPCGSDTASQSLPQLPVPSLHTPSLDPLSLVVTGKDYINVVPPTTHNILVPSPVTPNLIHAQSFHFLSNVCSPTITDSS
jgi:hypothetical protein